VVVRVGKREETNGVSITFQYSGVAFVSMKKDATITYPSRPHQDLRRYLITTIGRVHLAMISLLNVPPTKKRKKRSLNDSTCFISLRLKLKIMTERMIPRSCPFAL
jgi:hypothetical protein